MPTDNLDKAYIKKHKINDLLNDLYTTLTQNKPDDPIEFSYKYFESKLQPKTSAKSAFDSDIAIVTKNPLAATAAHDAGQNLLNKLIKNANDNMNISDVSRTKSALTAASNPLLTNFAILNRIDKIIIKNRKELTADEILERENLSNKYANKLSEEQEKSGDEDQENRPKRIFNYKSDLKNREKISHHKEELKKMVESELSKQKEPLDAGALYNKDFALNRGDLLERKNEVKAQRATIQLSNALSSESESERDLNDEILTARDHYGSSSRRNKKKKDKNNVNIRQVANENLLSSRFNRSESLAPIVKLMVCQFCSKLQQHGLKKTMDDGDAEKRLSGAEIASSEVKSGLFVPSLILDAEKMANNESGSPNDKENDEKTTKNIFDFFKNVASSQKMDNIEETNRKTENVDDDVVESASQVSGPRPITPYEAPTSRSAKENISQSLEKELDVSSWVLSRQKYQNAEVRTENDAKNELTNFINEVRKSKTVENKDGTAAETGSQTSRTLVSSRVGEKPKEPRPPSASSRLSQSKYYNAKAANSSPNQAPNRERKKSIDSNASVNKGSWVFKQDSSSELSNR